MPARRPVTPRPARKKPSWANKGIATSVNVKGQRMGVRVQRSGVDVVRETGFNVRTRKVGPKKRIVTI